jgi:hypothetical protein
MLTATNQGLLRGKANGQGQQLIFARANLHQQFNLLVSDGNVFYTRTKPQFDDDIWTVRTDGTGDHALINTNDDENIQDVRGPWLIYSKGILTPVTGVGGNFEQEVWSQRLDNGARHLLYEEEWALQALFYKADRVMFVTEYEVFDNTVTGTGTTYYASSLNGDHTGAIRGMRITDRAVIYGYWDQLEDVDRHFSRLFATRLDGGTTVRLDTDESYTNLAATIGNRVVYHHCPSPTSPTSGCDVVSIEDDGTDRVVLASHPANEVVQGVTTNQVIIRRNLAGNDQLVAGPVAGGPEKLLMSMTDNEFVDLIVGDLIIVRRPSGTWSLDLNGTLAKLGTVVGDSGFIAVGNSVCMTKVTAVWCMPLDGAGPQVMIANNGKVVGVL